MMDHWTEVHTPFHMANMMEGQCLRIQDNTLHILLVLLRFWVGFASNKNKNKTKTERNI